MKSFRAERQKRGASPQVLLTLLVLLASILLVRLLPADVNVGNSQKQNSIWEASIGNLP
ncbi:MAG: hypothetical protein HQ508_01180 [Candidatus Marinimicrobia bacterium]|nr:hypothetical protein [Candidatus Neomarinimicrobiota bacterium]